MMKKIYMTPTIRVASSILSSGMIASSPVPGNGEYNLGSQGSGESPEGNDNRKDKPIESISGGDALSKHRFYTGY